jgi:hypothetical protein
MDLLPATLNLLKKGNRKRAWSDLHLKRNLPFAAAGTR